MSGCGRKRREMQFMRRPAPFASGGCVAKRNERREWNSSRLKVMKIDFLLSNLEWHVLPWGGKMRAFSIFSQSHRAASRLKCYSLDSLSSTISFRSISIRFTSLSAVCRLLLSPFIVNLILNALCNGILMSAISFTEPMTSKTEWKSSTLFVNETQK